MNGGLNCSNSSKSNSKILARHHGAVEDIAHTILRCRVLLLGVWS